MITQAVKMIQAERLRFGIESKHMNVYKSFYELPFSGVLHRYGYIKALEYNIFAQHFQPEKSRGTVLLLHGYLDHAGSLSKTICFLLEQHYEVICYDLPGHGLSSGERVTINYFKEYLDTLKVVYDSLVLPRTNSPFLVAHSTGAMIGLEFEKRNKGSFSKMALIAPLFQPYLWRMTSIGLVLAKPFLRKFKRVFTQNSNEEAYLSFTKEDPLQEKVLPVSWLHALGRWFKDEGEEVREDLSFLMIQGQNDRTVNGTLGIKKTILLYPNSTITLIEDGRHQLLNESEVIREQTFFILRNYLST
ncbi:alpha/beta fold hydrolase [Halalkalibacter kiskunsagensis]|uniref:Alpha/beta fold hydrolase n=1 Tax=Halalkalibacter kiskunsagensis TaxID=1548599 RepID=A0ABV6KD06_9BACI